MLITMLIFFTEVIQLLIKTISRIYDMREHYNRISKPSDLTVQMIFLLIY